jgi:hypothetical protein
MLVGYARCSTDRQDLTAQHAGGLALGGEADRMYVDDGLTRTNRERPGLRAPATPPILGRDGCLLHELRSPPGEPLSGLSQRQCAARSPPAGRTARSSKIRFELRLHSRFRRPQGVQHQTGGASRADGP